MSGRRSSTRRASPTGVVVTVCRGCCCGTAAKHPDVDHDAQLDQLRRGLPDTTRMRVSDCLDACERSNVVVVTPSAAGRKAGGRPVARDRTSYRRLSAPCLLSARLVSR